MPYVVDFTHHTSYIVRYLRREERFRIKSFGKNVFRFVPLLRNTCKYDLKSELNLLGFYLFIYSFLQMFNIHGPFSLFALADSRSVQTPY